VAKSKKNKIVRYGLESGERRTVVSTRKAALSNAAVREAKGEGKLLYVKADRKQQRLMLKRLGGGGDGKVIYSRRSGTLWSTALSATRAYVTVLRGGADKIISVRR
jgi:hypothetical protein